MDLIEIGKHIRERRKELGLDQSTLATLAGIGINALVRLERGSGNPRFDVLFVILLFCSDNWPVMFPNALLRISRKRTDWGS